VTHFFVAVHKYFVCAPKSGQLISWLVHHNHSHYVLIANSNFSMNTECPHCQLAFRGEKGLAVHLNWSASCKSASKSLRHQDLRLLNINPAITTTPPNYNSNLKVPHDVFPCMVAKGAPTSYHTEQEDDNDAIIGAAFEDNRHIGAASDHCQHSTSINNHQYNANLEQPTRSGTNATNETTGFQQYGDQIESHMWSFLPNSSDMNSPHSYTHNTTTNLNNVYDTHNDELIDDMAATINLASHPHQSFDEDDLFGLGRYTQEEKRPHRFAEDPAKSQGSTQDI
jgi:hypothetical protein